jgi:hypothetical protein
VELGYLNVVHQGGKPRWGRLVCVEYPGIVNDNDTGPPSRNQNLRSVFVAGAPWAPWALAAPIPRPGYAARRGSAWRPPGHRLLATPRPAKGAPRPSPRGRAPAPGAAPPAAPWRAHRPGPRGFGTPRNRGSGFGNRGSGTVNGPRTWRFLAPRGWAAGPARHPPPRAYSPPLNPFSPVFARVCRLATGAGWGTATPALVRVYYRLPLRCARTDAIHDGSGGESGFRQWAGSFRSENLSIGKESKTKPSLGLIGFFNRIVGRWWPLGGAGGVTPCLGGAVARGSSTV